MTLMVARRAVLVLFAAVTAAEAVGSEAASPLARRAERMVSIPGAPLPPMDETTIRMSIAAYRPIVAGTRLVGTKAALARGLGFLATLHGVIGDRAQADPLFEEAQAIMEKHGSIGRDRAWLHNNRGLIQMEDGDYAKALPSFRAALDAVTPPPSDLLDARAKIQQNLASVQQFVGDLAGSEQSYLDALATLRRLGSAGRRTSQGTRANLAVLYASIGDHERVRTLVTELLKEKGLGANVRFAALNALGFSLTALKEYAEAERRLLEAQAISDEASHRVVVQQNLGAMYYHSGDFERTRRTYEEALPLAEESYGAESRVVAGLNASLGSVAMVNGDLVKADVLLTRSRKVLSRIEGDREPLAAVIRNLAIVAERRGQRERAVELSREALAIEKENFDRILAFGSEAQRLTYRAAQSPYDQLANLGDAVLLADAVLSMKGAVFESLLLERTLARRSTAPADRELLDRIHVRKVELMERMARGEHGLESIERELKQEETALARSVAVVILPDRRRPKLELVQARLAKDEVLVEIVRYQFLEQNGKTTWSYGGLVIPSAGFPKWIRLGQADDLDRKINRLLGTFWPVAPINRGVDRESIGRNAARIAYEIEKQLWEPLERALPPGVRRVLLSPDGATHFVPWAALPNDADTFLAERFQIIHVASGRDLVRETAATKERTILAFADGKGDLPETRREVEDIRRHAGTHKWRATVFEGEEATEAQLLREPVHRILHFATHGGEWEGNFAPVIESRLNGNPMYRSYILLGGARAALEAWKRDAAPPFFNDGVLTAEEASGLNLRGNWLTVLSACRTGRGDSRAGEGVIGLRRGFALAGSENLLFTLADVGDEPTAQFMSELYRRLLASSDLIGVFHETQCAELRRWKKESGVIAAIRKAGAFVLTVGPGSGHG